MSPRIVFDTIRLSIALMAGCCGILAHADSTNATSTPTPPKAMVAKIGAPAPAKKLSGAELYSMHCNRCHPERYPAERTAAQWKTIVMHMRVRANIPGAQARTLLQYMQDNSGN